MPMSSFGVIPTLSFRDVATVGLRPQAVFGIGSAVLLGSTFWHSFIGGPVAYTTVPRAQFRAIQEKIFPILFTAQTGLSATLLGFWFKLHPRVRTLDGFFDSAPDSLTAIALATMTLAGAVNLLAVGPATTTVMNARVKQEEAEGKTYDQPGVSEKMKQLSAQFSRLHGVSSLTNLVFVGASLLAQSLTAVYGVDA